MNFDRFDKFNRLSDEMGRKANSNKPTDEALLFSLIQHCLMTKNMKKIRLSEISSLFQEMYSIPLTINRNLIDLLRSPNIGVMCTVKQMDQLIWIEPTPEFAEMNKKVQEMRGLHIEEPKSQTAPPKGPSAKETKKHVKEILPDNTPLEYTPHYKMFVVEFSDTLRTFLEDIDFGIEDHVTLLWLYLIHLFTIAKKKYRVSVSELPELFRYYYGQTLDLNDKLVTTLQEDCYLVCQVEKFKNDWHVKPSDELVHFLSTDVGDELQDIISYHLKNLRERYNSDFSTDDEFPDDMISIDEDDEPVTRQTKQNTVSNKNNKPTVNNNVTQSSQRSNQQKSQPSANNAGNKSSGNQKQSNNAKQSVKPKQQHAQSTATVNTVPATSLVLNGTDIGTYGQKGRDLAMKEHLENERKKTEQADASNRQTKQTQQSKQQAQPHNQQATRSPVSESSNKAASKANNNNSAQWVKKSEVSNNTNASPQPQVEKTSTSTTTSTAKASTSSSTAHANNVKSQATTAHLSGAEQLADTVRYEFSCNMCNQILRRPVESTCCHKLVCYVCSLFNGLCPICKKPGQRVTFVENHVVNHLMDQLTMPCPYKQCDEWVQLSEIFLHKEHCEHKPEPCPHKGCGASKHYSELDVHINACPFAVITCACKQHIKRRDLEKHQATCKKSQQGQNVAARTDMKQAQLKVPCPYGCDAQVDQSALEAHGNQLVNCTNYGCPAVLKHRDLIVHRDLPCAFRRIECTNGCGWQGAVKDFNKHCSTCKIRK